MRILILNQKGGVGKTTISILLAATLQKAGLPVTITDLDPHETASALSSLKFKIPSKAQPGAHEIVDIPSQFDPSTPKGRRVIDLIATSDRILIVSEKSYLAYYPTLSTAKIVAKHRSQSSKVYILFNKIRADHVSEQFDNSGVVSGYGWPVLKSSLEYSINFERYLSEGLSAMKPCQQEEMIQLAIEILA